MANTAIGAVAGGAMGLMNTVLTNHFAQVRANRDRQQNFAYNEQSAENAYNRQRAMMEEYMTPEAQIRHLKAAGLSPSLMYGAGGGTQGVSTPAGNGSGNIQTPTSGMDITAITQLAQIANLEAQTRKTNAEADTEEGKNDRGAAQIAQILTDNDYKKAGIAFTESQTALNKLTYYIQDQKKEFEISTAESLSLQAEQNAIKAMYEAQNEGLQFELNVKTFDEKVKQAEQNTKLIAAEIAKKISDINLNNNQIYQIVENVKLAYRETVVKEDALKLENNKYEFDKFKWSKEMELEVEKFNKQLHFEGHKTKVDAITNIIGRAFSFFIGASVLKAGTQNTIQPPTPNVNVNGITIPNGYEGLPFRY